MRCESSGIILTWSKRVQPKQMVKVNMLVLIMIVVIVVDCRDLLDKQEWVMAASGVCRHLLEEVTVSGFSYLCNYLLVVVFVCFFVY